MSETTIQARFIPTPVGNTRGGDKYGRERPVHPHACGEHGTRYAEGAGESGSSPRLWGTPEGSRRMTAVLRFIPTPVGNTLIRAGSRQPPRFIPTPVGNTPQKPARPSKSPVHPHACGEHISNAVFTADILGSSPRLWGTLSRQRVHPCPHRFIPTPVGNTLSVPIECINRSVHPHACGEHIRRLITRQRSAGSSPRLWGTQAPNI